MEARGKMTLGLGTAGSANGAAAGEGRNGTAAQCIVVPRAATTTTTTLRRSRMPSPKEVCLTLSICLFVKAKSSFLTGPLCFLLFVLPVFLYTCLLNVDYVSISSEFREISKNFVVLSVDCM